MTNFDVFLCNPSFAAFAAPAANAEKILPIDAAACVLSCRRSMEAAIKWMYSADDSLDTPEKDSLIVLLNQPAFRALVGDDLWRRMDAIRRLGNLAAHEDDPIPRDKALLCLENLFIFLDFIAFCYGEDGYEKGRFDASLPSSSPFFSVSPDSEPDASFKALQAENARLKAELTSRRQSHRAAYSAPPLSEISPEKRRLYIDTLLRDAGWIQGKNCRFHIPLSSAGGETADAILFDVDQTPLALVEWEGACLSPHHGRYRALRQADAIENLYGRRPLIFLTDGFYVRLINDAFEPERLIPGLYSQQDLQRLVHLQNIRRPLQRTPIHSAIADRPYQQEAIQKAAEAFEKRSLRRCLLSMAPGTGKTRVALGLCDLLSRQNWAGNILFLCENDALLLQARRSLRTLCPAVPSLHLHRNTQHLCTPFIFSTYDTLLRCLDQLRNTGGPPLSCGHFDLIVCDEASVMLEHVSLLDFFDARVLALTSVPPSYISPSLYTAFEMGRPCPTYAYSFSQAVQSGYIVPFKLVEAKLRFQEEGIVFKDLSVPDQKAYRSAFPNSMGDLPERIDSSALSQRILNRDSIREALHVFMDRCLWIHHGQTLGKTIFFASGRRHAKMILEVFQSEYPAFSHSIMILDHRKKDQASILRGFSNPDGLPSIVISLHLMDDGIDVPEVLNLVFFRKVSDQSHFLSMIGRGCRLCPGLVNGADKTHFLVFDFCGNVQSFREDSAFSSEAPRLTLQGQIFRLKAQIAYSLEETSAYRASLLRDVQEAVAALDRSLFAVQLYRKQVEIFSQPSAYQPLSYENLLFLIQELAPLIPASGNDPDALRLDILFYEGMLSRLTPDSPHSSALLNALHALLRLRSPQVKAHLPLLRSLTSPGALSELPLSQLEDARCALRSLGRFLPRYPAVLETDFDDQILSITVHEMSDSAP